MSPAVRIRHDESTRAETVARAAAALKDGGIAFLPAEGVYGYHALASRPEALARLAALKQRGSGSDGKGWIALVGRSEDAYRWVRALPAPAAALIRAHWPGPLTLILDSGPSLPTALRAADGTVALRCPGSALLRDVIQASGGLVVSTSANEPGAPPATEPMGPGQEPDGVDLVVDAGPLSGQVSTIVRVEGEAFRIVRQGAVSLPGSPLDRTPDPA